MRIARGILPPLLADRDDCLYSAHFPCLLVARFDLRSKREEQQETERKKKTLPNLVVHHQHHHAKGRPLPRAEVEFNLYVLVRAAQTKGLSMRRWFFMQSCRVLDCLFCSLITFVLILTPAVCFPFYSEDKPAVFFYPAASSSIHSSPWFRAFKPACWTTRLVNTGPRCTAVADPPTVRGSIQIVAETDGRLQAPIPRKGPSFQPYPPFTHNCAQGS